MEIEIGDVIASRKLKVISGPDGGSIVEVLLGRPRPTPDARDFLVPYLIKSTASEKRQCAVGIDEFQALQLALKILDAELEAFERRNNLKLFWEGDDSGDLGFGRT